MNKDWSELNKTMQSQIGKAVTFEAGIGTLFSLRQTLMDTLFSLKEELSREDFDAMPFINADGYHSKNIAYSIWHIFRIEDIVAHDLIKGDEEVFFREGYQERINSPIITTGNELVKGKISEFTSKLDIDELYSYINAVKGSTEDILADLSYQDMKLMVSDGRKDELKKLKVVSRDESAVWLIDYWCSKDVRGLIKMPFSRHWIMHIEASLRIRDKLKSGKGKK